MIYSKKNKVLFLHNPKTAGSALRKSLKKYGAPFGELYGYGSHQGSCPYKLDYAHITISELRQYVPSLWEELCGYEKVAVVRCARSRFYSSVNEYSRVFSGTDIRFAPLSQRKRFLFELVERLAERPCAEALLEDYTLTHFRPQWMYVQEHRDGVCGSEFGFVNCYYMEDIQKLIDDLRGKFGAFEVDSGSSNSSEQFEVGPFFAALLGNNALKKRLRQIPGSRVALDLYRKSVLNVMEKPSLEPNIRFGLTDHERGSLDDFVDEFYRCDVKLLSSLRKLASNG